MDLVLQFVDFFLHLDRHLDVLIQDYGVWTYTILFLIIFCETGLVVTPILPGDSLLFAAGTFAGRGALNVESLILVLMMAAILGDALNYHIGAYLGPKVFKEKSRWFRQEYLERTKRFYDKYGGKTIVIARFVPIVRTFAPFLAGIGRMGYLQFLTYNAIGAAIWIFSLVLAGYYFSEIPLVKNNFSLVVLAIIIISILPAVFEVLASRKESRMKGTAVS